MADLSLKASYRRTTRTDLYRLTGPFKLGSILADTGTEVYLTHQTVAGVAFLDADVVTGWVGLAPSTRPPYTGTRWALQRNDDATWSFLNQGQDEHMLAGAADSVTLGRLPAGDGMERFATTRWLLYHDLTGFRLRPAMRVTGWLGARDDRPVLSAPQDVVGPWVYWGIIALPVSEPEVLA